MDIKDKKSKQLISLEEIKTLEGVAAVPCIIYEMSERRHEKIRNKLLLIISCLIVLLVGCNMAWLWVFQSYDMVSYAQDGEGYNNIVTGTVGDILNGAKATGQN